MQMLAVVSFKSFTFAVDRPLNGLSNTKVVSVLLGIIWTLIVLGIAYMLLDIWLFEVDRCSPLICTEGYPCFEQGDCPASIVPD